MSETLNISIPPSPAGETPALEEISSQSSKLPRPRRGRIAIKNDGKILFLNPAVILTVEAQGNYVVLHRESGPLRLRESISLMAEKLLAFGFIRIHRSVLVNRFWVEEIRPLVAGDYLLRLTGGRELTVTRTYKKNLLSLAELWLTNDNFSAN